MKILNSVQELWLQCLYCPLCQDVTRTITVTSILGTEVIHWRKVNAILKLRCFIGIPKKSKQIINFNINCLDNTVEIHSNEKISDKISHVQFQFIGGCDNCFNTFSIGTFTLDIFNKKIEEISIDKDSVQLLSEEGNYHVSLIYYSDSMLISKCLVKNDGGIVECGEVTVFPIVELDFTQPKKIINKIKTLLLFS